MQHVTFTLPTPKSVRENLLWTVKQSHLQGRQNFIQARKFPLSCWRWSVDLRLVYKLNMAVLRMVKARAMVLLQEDEHVGSSFEKGGWHVKSHLRTHRRPVAEDGMKG